MKWLFLIAISYYDMIAESVVLAGGIYIQVRV
jgi:hypothetical protein